MQQGNATILVIVGLFLMYLAISGRLANAGDAWDVLNNGRDGSSSSAVGGLKLPQIPSIGSGSSGGR